jgi:hypothetical protein
MKTIISCIILLCGLMSVQGQHIVRLVNTTGEDILVRLYFQEDDPSCSGSSSSANYFVPAFNTSVLATPIAPPGGSDFILFGVKVLESGLPVIPVTSTAHGSTPNVTWNVNACPLGISPPLPIVYQSAFSLSWVFPAWTSSPIIPLTFTSTGNTMHEDEITF